MINIGFKKKFLNPDVRLKNNHLSAKNKEKHLHQSSTCAFKENL